MAKRGPKPTYRDMAERLLTRSVVLPDGCWMWLGRTTKDGYPLLNVRQEGRHVTLRVHRVSFEVLGGGVLIDGQELDHTCHFRACIHPEHLVQRTKLANLANRRGYATSYNPATAEF